MHVTKISVVSQSHTAQEKEYYQCSENLLNCENVHLSDRVWFDFTALEKSKYLLCCCRKKRVHIMLNSIKRNIYVENLLVFLILMVTAGFSTCEKHGKIIYLSPSYSRVQLETGIFKPEIF